MAGPVAIFGGIDGGGTTFKCGIGNSDGQLIDTHRVPTTTPYETLAACASYFRSIAGPDGLKGLGIASFGPVDIDPRSAGYGTILTTPKPGWSGTDLRAVFRDSLSVDAVVDTDVNGALLAEMRHGAAKGARSAAYITVGTGIGAGLFVNGALAGGPTHPEFGHIPLHRHPGDHDFGGVCPFHGDCLEGLASVTAMRARWGEPAALPATHPGWTIIASYLAQACRVLTLTLRLERIVIGGGLMLAPHLLGLVRAAYDAQMAGYLGDMAVPGEALIRRPGLGDDAGLVGAVLLASATDMTAEP